MKIKSWLVSGAALCALATAGCSSGPNISPITIGLSAPFCTDTKAFQAQAATLEAAASSGTLAALRTDAAAARQGLLTIQTDAAKLPDKVSGHLVKDDIGVAVDTYTSVTAALQAANPSDPNAVSNALASVQNKEGQAFTQATARLDAYTKKVCGLVVSNATTTTSAPSSTSAGPTTTGPGTTVAGATTTTAAVVGPVAPTTTTQSTTPSTASASSTTSSAPAP